MRTDRMSVRAWLAMLLVGSAVLFFIGIYIERGLASTPSPPAVAAPSPQAAASQPAEGEGGEAGEAGHSAEPAASAEAAAGETGTEHNAEWRPFGIDLESPLPVGGAIVASLALAVAVLVLRSWVVGLAVLGFAVLFGFFDLLEVAHQLDVARSNLAAIAVVLLVVHVAAGLLAIRLLVTQRGVLAAR